MERGNMTTRISPTFEHKRNCRNCQRTLCWNGKPDPARAMCPDCKLPLTVIPKPRYGSGYPSWWRKPLAKWKARKP